MTEVYTQGYEDGAYRLEQMPHMDYIQQHYQIVEDIGVSTAISSTQVREYVEGWTDGYNKQEKASNVPRETCQHTIK